MNRRDVLKRLAGIPLLGALVPVAAASFKGMDLASGPDMTVGFKCVNGHPFCNLCVTPVDLSEQSIENMLKEIAKHPGPLTVKPTHVYVRLHEFGPAEFCIHCGASAEAIEDGLEPLGCWKRPASPGATWWPT